MQLWFPFAFLFRVATMFEVELIAVNEFVTAEIIQFDSRPTIYFQRG